MDVKNAFLNVLIEDEAFLQPAQGFVHNVDLKYVFKLKKAAHCVK